MARQRIDCPNCGNTNQVPGFGVGDFGDARCSRLVYILLAIFLGPLGVHNFVAGHTTRAVIELLLTILIGWLIIPLLIVYVLIIFDIVTTTHDADGNRMP